MASAAELFDTIVVDDLLEAEPEPSTDDEPKPRRRAPALAKAADAATIDLIVEPQRVESIPAKHLVFEGGGTRGIAYAGALEALKDHITIGPVKTAAGTSIGAFVAFLFAAGYSCDEVNAAIKEFNPRKFLKVGPSTIRKVLGFILGKICCIGCSCCGRSPANPLITGSKKRDYRGTSGILNSDGIYQSLGEYLARKTLGADITFAELYAKTGIQLVATGTNLATGETDYFTHTTTPAMIVRQAILCSMSYPFLFDAVLVQNGETTNCYIDGGLSNNYPMDYLKSILMSAEHETILGLKLETAEETDGDLDLSGPVTYARHLIDIMGKTIEGLRLPLGQQADGTRTININTGHAASFDANITTDERAELLERGRYAVEQYFAF